LDEAFCCSSKNTLGIAVDNRIDRIESARLGDGGGRKPNTA